jgi:hypothetical protein
MDCPRIGCGSWRAFVTPNESARRVRPLPIRIHLGLQIGRCVPAVTKSHAFASVNESFRIETFFTSQ